jgi:hypothetical protein
MRLLLYFGLLVSAVSIDSTVRADDDSKREFFEKKIRPVLVRYCYECHSTAASKVKGELLVDSRDSIRRGGETGPAVVPGKPSESLILSALRHESLEMPPDRKLPENIIADFETWIKTGASDPRDTPLDPEESAAATWDAVFQERLQFWSLQPVKHPQVPTVQHESWSASAIDRFIMARLESSGLQPAPRADRRTLVRRAAFAVTGLPPTQEMIDAYIADESSEDAAWSSLVSRLLDSPHFGERWARHWMDVVRYTDTYGYEWDMPAKGAWRYRDYLIRAFNTDVGFDQLVREQIAGDLLEEPRLNHELKINESLIGPMFFQMGEKRHGDSSEFNGIHQEMLDNKIDAFSKAFLATTVACARCHDHKLDPVAQKEYYALAGAFMSSRWLTNTVDLPERNAAAIAELKSLKSRMKPLLAQLWIEESGGIAEGLAERGGAWKPLLEQRLEKTPPIEDPLFVFTAVLKAEAERKDTGVAWAAVAAQYAQQSKDRREHNASNFNTVADFRDGVPEDWSVDGTGLTEITRCGDFVVSLSGDTAVTQLLAGGLYTNTLSPRLNGAVRTPWLSRFSGDHLSFEHSGGDFACRRTVIDNAFLTEKQQYLNNTAPSWVSMHTRSPDRHTYIEFATKTSNPNFPPRVGLGGACSEEQAADPRSWFGITRVVRHKSASTPQDELVRFDRLFSGEAPQSVQQAADRYATWFSSAIRAWASDSSTAEDVSVINWLLKNKGLTTSGLAEKQSAIATLVEEYRIAEKAVKNPHTVNGMADVDDGFDYRLNIRGDYDQLADPVPRGWLKSLAGEASTFTDAGSGRQQLAEQISRADNPLTARVYVNRVWHWLFGTGIVATPSDFGLLGDRPSHPELLDWLTSRFIDDGWSTKKLIHRILLSQVWQQSGAVSQQALSVDPRNRLLHHYATRRLEAEAIRDAILAVSGGLDAKLFGPVIDPYRANEDPKKRLFSGPVDGNGRRSIYTKITIMEAPKFLSLFNQPKPKIPTGHRDVSSTPSQSLALLNDPFVKGQSQIWSSRLVSSDYASPRERIAHMLSCAFAREPSPGEIDRWTAAIADLSTIHGVPADQVMQHAAVWTDVAHAVFNSKEFIYVR